MTSPFALEATNLAKSFGREPSITRALNGISLKLRAGAFAIARGPSGSGKSSLLAALGGLQAPDSGEVTALGENLWAGGSGKVRTFRRNNCGYVFQSHGLFPALGARDQIAVPLIMLGLSPKDALARAQAALDMLGLADRRDALPEQLSGGQNQRIAIARMLAKRPSLLFCDEPTSALDSGNGRLVAELLRQAAKKNNAMVLCMTHDERLLPYSDRVLEIEDGRLISDTENAA